MLVEAGAHARHPGNRPWQRAADRGSQQREGCGERQGAEGDIVGVESETKIWKVTVVEVGLVSGVMSRFGENRREGGVHVRSMCE